MLAVEFKNLIKQIGIPCNWNDLRATYRYNADEKQFRAFEEDMLNLVRRGGNFDESLNVIMKHIDLFDKEQYVFRVARLLEKEINEEKSIFSGTPQQRVSLNYPKTNRQQAFQTAKKSLRKVDIIDVELSKKRIDLYSSQEFIGNKNFFDKRKEKTAALLQRIEETIGLENVLGYIKPTDLIQCCKYPNLGNVLAVRIIENSATIDINNAEYQDKVLGKEGLKKKAEENEAKAKTFRWEDFFEAVKKYAQYIELDKVLLLANTVYYNKYGDGLENFTQEEARELKDFTDKVGTLLDNPKVSIDSPRFNRTITYSELKEWVYTLNRHYIGGEFHTDEQISELANDIVNGRCDVSDISPEEFKDIIAFTAQEVGYILENAPESLGFMLENEYIDEEMAKEALSTQEEVPDEELLYLYKNNLVTNEVLAELLKKKVINVDGIRLLKENEVKERPLESIASSKKMVELYLDKENSPEEFEEYRRLYKLLKVEGKSIKEQKENADLLIDENLDLLEEDRIYDLYRMGLIPIDTTIEFIGKDALLNAFANGELKPTDSKRLYDSGTITIAMIREILKKPEIDDGQKLVLIYSTFPDKDDVKTRSKLIDYLKDAADNFKNSGKGPKRKREPKPEDPVPQNKYVSDPCSRWKLISNIDKDYSQEYLKDGHIIFYLPNEEKYIIEKLYDKNRKPAYGAATYILDERTYEQNKDEIIKDGKIDKSTLVSLRGEKPKEVKKLIHTGWGNAVLKYFGIQDSKKYSKEQCRIIKELADEVEKTKRPLDDDERE